MAKQDEYVRYTIRVPRPVYERMAALPGEGSINARIVNALDAAGSGMTLRDWFAGQAITGLLASGDLAYDLTDTDERAAYAAFRAFAMADAMLAERQKGGA